MIQLTKKDLKEYRERWHKEQKFICPLFKKKYSHQDMVMDHDHSTGLCRGTIHRNANQIEGKIRSVFIRFGGRKEIGLSDFLRNLADYLDHNRSNECIVYPIKAKRKKAKKAKKKTRTK